MEPFPDMAKIVPECAQGRARVRHITLDEVGGKTASYLYGQYRPSPPGTYVSLRITNDAGVSQVMMSDLYYERVTCVEVVRHARGNLLIAGLGIGMILHPILEKPEVASVTVIEKYQEVVDLISPTLPADPRLSIIVGDIFVWRPQGVIYDVIWFDIWPDYEVSRLSEMAELHERFRPYLNPNNPDVWMESWHRKETIELSGIEAQKTLS